LRELEPGRNCDKEDGWVMQRDANEDDWPIASVDARRWFATGEGTHGETRTLNAVPVLDNDKGERNE
jgi:hypothetical protein